jgi:hypothetical protein
VHQCSQKRQCLLSQAVGACQASEQAQSFEELALVAVRYEHTQRRRMLSTSRHNNFDHTVPGATAPGLQLTQLHHRITAMLPSKLRGKLLTSGKAVLELELACLAGAEVEKTLDWLRQSLAECEWSAAPQLDGMAPVEMALSMWHQLLLWCDLSPTFLAIDCHFPTPDAGCCITQRCNHHSLCAA